MAEFLVFYKENWMDLLSKDRPDLTGQENVIRKINENTSLNNADKTTAIFKKTMKYNARNQIGDIIERRQNGTGMVGKEPLSFALIKVPPMSFEKAELYTGTLFDGNLYKYKCRCSLNMSSLTLDENKEVELTTSEFNTLLTEKV